MRKTSAVRLGSNGFKRAHAIENQLKCLTHLLSRREEVQAKSASVCHQRGGETLATDVPWVCVVKHSVRDSTHFWHGTIFSAT